MQRSYIGKLFKNSFTRPIGCSIMRSIATKTVPRTLLNKYYTSLDEYGRSRFHARFSKIFRKTDATLAPGEWVVHFVSKTIRLPLRPEWSWLDWDCAVSVLGHDVEVKKTYAALISSEQRPSLFLDIGANYGTHSILFLSAGIPVISFEPNPTCVQYFKSVCDLNGLKGRWEQVAIGNDIGPLELVYPDKATWVGSVSPDIASTMKESGPINSEIVSQMTLDDYVANIPSKNVLIKIDAEGYELEVLQGASQVVRHSNPIIIFESNDATKREALFQMLVNFRYELHSLPWSPQVASPTFNVDEFITSKDTNFIALPHA